MKLPIPKILHAIWFGDQKELETNPLIQRCIRSWYDHLPAWDRRLWTEEDPEFKELYDKSEYFREAVDKKLWRGASDYFRLFILEKHGGVYVDTDVELFKPIADEYRENKFFSFVEHDLDNHPIWSADGRVDAEGKVRNPAMRPVTNGMCMAAFFIASEPNGLFVRKCMRMFDNLCYPIRHTTMHTGYPTLDQLMADWAIEQGFRYVDKVQMLDDLCLYPSKEVPCSGRFINDEVRATALAGHWDAGYVRKESVGKPFIPKVLIAVPTSGAIRTETFESIFNLEHDGIDVTLHFARGYGLARARNLIAMKALDEGYTHAMTIDDDVTFPPDTLKRLLAMNKPVATAWVPQSDGTSTVAVYSRKDENDPGGYNCKRLEELPKQTGLFDADASALSCTLISTELYSKLAFPWYQWVEYPNRGVLTEDLFFCDRLRRELGMKVTVDLDLRCGHIKTVTL